MARRRLTSASILWKCVALVTTNFTVCGDMESWPENSSRWIVFLTLLSCSHGYNTREKEKEVLNMINEKNKKKERTQFYLMGEMVVQASALAASRASRRALMPARRSSRVMR